MSTSIEEAINQAEAVRDRASWIIVELKMLRNNDGDIEYLQQQMQRLKDAVDVLCNTICELEKQA